MQRNSYFVRTKPPSLLLRNKSKLLSFALKRLTYKTLGSALQQLKKNSQQMYHKMLRIQKVSLKFTDIDIIKAWQKMKMFTIKQKGKDRVIKDIFILAKRFQKTLLKDSFCKLINNTVLRSNPAVQKVEQSRKIIMSQCLKKLFMNNKKHSWHKLKLNVAQSKIKKRLTVINILFKGAQKRNILYAWTSIKASKGRNNKLLTQKIQDLSLQLQDMRIQVQNKNENINRLQQQITQLRQNSTIRIGQGNSILFNNSYGNRSASNLNRSRSRNNNSFDKESNDGSGIKDTSFGSFLGGISILSYRSRGSNVGNKGQECNCNVCGYRQKYEKYKATNDTLKKQLDIIKTQLQFTKDMNQHMQNQIRSQVTAGDQEKKMERLRQQLKQSHKQRQALRDKVLKYDKYVGKLKLQFKTKIQEIYRKVKKGT